MPGIFLSIIQLAPIAVDVAEKIKALLDSTGSFDTDLKNFQAASLQSVADTQSVITAWKSAHPGV